MRRWLRRPFRRRFLVVGEPSHEDLRRSHGYSETVRAKGVVLREDGPYACPCCRYRTLQARGEYDLCPVCFWEDDGQDDPYAEEVWGGPNGPLSLATARANYQHFGAADEASVSKVRPPLPEESWDQ